jgi:hypothetical protein
MTTVQEAVDAARRDLMAVASQDVPARALDSFVRKRFNQLVPSASGDYLVVRNSNGKLIAVDHIGPNQFRVTDQVDRLDIKGGTKCDAEGLLEELARLNSPQRK